MPDTCLQIRVAVLASGSGTNLQAIIDAAESGELPATIAAVFSDKDDAYALERAKKHAIEAVHINPNDFASRLDYDDQLVVQLKAREIDLVVLAGYMLIVGPQIVRAFPGRIMNIHPALLPSFPGLHGVRDAIEYGVKITGVTVHFVDEGLDTGSIILQGAVLVEEDDDEQSLHQRIHEIEYRLYPEAIKLFAEGRLEMDGRRVRINRQKGA